jgi:hypothetical protein
VSGFVVAQAVLKKGTSRRIDKRNSTLGDCTLGS